MIPPFEFRQQIIHSLNPYIHKYCGCIHLRMGATLSCLVWMGFSLYFAILSFQAKSPFYSYIHNTVMYIFGTINLIFFVICFGTLIPIYLRSYHGIRTASLFIICAVIVLLVDTLANVIVFGVQKDEYTQWCISSASQGLDTALSMGDQATQTQGFSSNARDFYNCSRTWEDELKFGILCFLLMLFVYFYWAISLISYGYKLRIEMRTYMFNEMNKFMPPTGMMGTLGGPMVTGADIML